MADVLAKNKTPTYGGVITSDHSVPKLSPQLTDLQNKLRDAKTTFTQDKDAWIKARGGLETPGADTFKDEQTAVDAAQKAYDAQYKQEQGASQVQDQFRNLGKQQQDAADQFRTAFPSIVENNMAPLRAQARKSIAQGVSQNKAGYNQRGLLYSGLRAGGENDVSRDVSNSLNQAKTGLNQTLSNEQMQLDQAPIQTGLAASALQGQQADINNDYTNNILNALMNQSASNTQSVNSLLGAGGQLGGALAGGLINQYNSPAPLSNPGGGMASPYSALPQFSFNGPMTLGAGNYLGPSRYSLGGSGVGQ